LHQNTDILQENNNKSPVENQNFIKIRIFLNSSPAKKEILKNQEKVLGKIIKMIKIKIHDNFYALLRKNAEKRQLESINKMKFVKQMESPKINENTIKEKKKEFEKRVFGDIFPQNEVSIVLTEQQSQIPESTINQYELSSNQKSTMPLQSLRTQIQNGIEIIQKIDDNSPFLSSLEQSKNRGLNQLLDAELHSGDNILIENCGKIENKYDEGIPKFIQFVTKFFIKIFTAIKNTPKRRKPQFIPKNIQKPLCFLLKSIIHRKLKNFLFLLKNSTISKTHQTIPKSSQILLFKQAIKCYISRKLSELCYILQNSKLEKTPPKPSLKLSLVNMQEISVSKSPTNKSATTRNAQNTNKTASPTNKNSKGKFSSPIMTPKNKPSLPGKASFQRRNTITSKPVIQNNMTPTNKAATPSRMLHSSRLSYPNKTTPTNKAGTPNNTSPVTRKNSTPSKFNYTNKNNTPNKATPTNKNSNTLTFSSKIAEPTTTNKNSSSIPNKSSTKSISPVKSTNSATPTNGKFINKPISPKRSPDTKKEIKKTQAKKIETKIPEIKKTTPSPRKSLKT